MAGWIFMEFVFEIIPLEGNQSITLKLLNLVTQV
jgi:hypothetical protein